MHRAGLLQKPKMVAVKPEAELPYSDTFIEKKL